MIWFKNATTSKGQKSTSFVAKVAAGKHSLTKMGHGLFDMQQAAITYQLGHESRRKLRLQ
jgi:hypothetical protein